MIKRVYRLHNAPVDRLTHFLHVDFLVQSHLQRRARGNGDGNGLQWRGALGTFDAGVILRAEPGLSWGVEASCAFIAPWYPKASAECASKRHSALSPRVAG